MFAAAEVENSRYVRSHESSANASLLFEQRLELGLVPILPTQHFDSDRVMEGHVSGPIDVPHPSSREQPLETVALGKDTSVVNRATLRWGRPSGLRRGTATDGPRPGIECPRRVLHA